MEKEKASGTDSSLEYRTAKNHPQDCCCCIPLRGGIIAANVISIVFVIIAFALTFMMFADDYFDSYYSWINLVIVVGFGLTGVVLIMLWVCTTDNKSRRKGLALGYLLILIMWVLLSIWNIIYINELY